MKILFIGPVETRSGYGSRSRDICKSLIKLGYDLKIISLPWGTTPRNALDMTNESDLEIYKRIVTVPGNNEIDICIHCSIPNEFLALGKYNIGITAGIETDICSADWIEGCNRMDLVLTSSNHSKTVLEKTEYQKRDKKTQALVDIIKCNTEIEVLIEGIDTNVFKKLETVPTDNIVTASLNDVPEKFGFLFVGHWLQGDLGHDRKDIGMLIKTFLTTFSNYPIDRRPALFLKTTLAGFSLVESNTIENRVRQIFNIVEDEGFINLPSVYLLYGDLTDTEMNELYNHPKVKAMVSFSKGEGFGRPLLEFTVTGKPVIASNWSGQTDFLNKEYSQLLLGGTNIVHPSAVNKWILADSKWFTVNYTQAGKILKECFNNYKTMKKNSVKQAARTLNEFTIDNMTSQLSNYLKRVYEKRNKNENTIPLKLPNLKKIQ